MLGLSTLVTITTSPAKPAPALAIRRGRRHSIARYVVAQIASEQRGAQVRTTVSGTTIWGSLLGIGMDFARRRDRNVDSAFGPRRSPGLLNDVMVLAARRRHGRHRGRHVP